VLDGAHSRSSLSTRRGERLKSPFILYTEDIEQIEIICQALYQGAYAKSVFVVDKDGQLVAQRGETMSIDTTALASLTAGAIAAAGGLAQLIGEKEFPVQLHEGERESIHTSLVGDRFILVLIFDERSSLGLVRMKLKKAHQELATLLQRFEARDAEPSAQPKLFSEISDDDIEALFDSPGDS